MTAAWLERLRERLDQPPAPPRVPLALAVGGATPPAVIGSIEATLALRLAAAALPLRDAGDAWRIEVPNAAAIAPTLAAIAQWLQANGCAGASRNELLAVADGAGRSVGAIERAVVRALGIATQAVHLIVRDERGQVWIQPKNVSYPVGVGPTSTGKGGPTPTIRSQM